MMVCRDMDMVEWCTTNVTCEKGETGKAVCRLKFSKPRSQDIEPRFALFPPVSLEYIDSLPALCYPQCTRSPAVCFATTIL